MSRKKTDTQPTLPFGKHKGKSINAVWEEEPSYLCWFVLAVDGHGYLKQAILTLPGFKEEQAKRQQRRYGREANTRQIVEETVRRLLGMEPPSPEAIDDLCDQLFHGAEPQDMARLRIVKGLHYGDYVQSGENLSCEKTGDEVYRFQVRDERPPCREYEPWTVTPETDLSEVPLDLLAEMDTQMYYCGETEELRDAKFSETRKHVQREMALRSPS
jgi:hypothetical protein